MSKIYCVKLKKEAEALDYQPYPGAVGEKIVANIYAEAWDMWVNHQTMLINEMRLTPVDPKARKLLEDEMEKFLFGRVLLNQRVIRLKNDYRPGSSVGRAED